MRFDLIPERDRFIPGWHCRPDTLRAESYRPEWQWPSRLYRIGQAILRSLLQGYRVARSLSGAPKMKLAPTTRRA